ncbi:MAG: DUF4982 domain-containing protein [Bacteroidales bacterium]|nr:DUF4982 domain-containing protein [Bacteroidales bacterium]
MKKCMRIASLILLIIGFGGIILAQPASTGREKISFNQDWKFLGSDNPQASEAAFNDSQWRNLDLPHDWSIEGSFSESNPAGFNGGALPGGIGWYRKTFKLPSSSVGKMIYIDFDGIYRNSEVWINGHYLGKRAYGYSSFQYDITPYVKPGVANVIAVKVDNSVQPNSRWYSGSGIYRNVWLELTGKVAIDHWGTYITTPDVSKVSAIVNIQSKITNKSGKNLTVNVKSIIYDSRNLVAARTEPQAVALKESPQELLQEVRVVNPRLWTIADPNLYRVVTYIEEKGKVLDMYETTIGLRSFEFDSEKGFILNGEQVKIKGVCNHHDLGCLGSAINYRALERQLEILKEMGCNGIRTSHNPPAPELLDLCDKMGFIVMDEAFDMWKIKKCAHDFSFDFQEWYQRDLEDMVLRDRNHPSIFMWSIGNEIMEQWDSTGIPMARELAGIVRKLDPTRPITSACNDPSPNNYLIKSDALDLIGYNYQHLKFANFPEAFPGKKFIGSETTSALSTRGSYDMPADSVKRWPIKWDEKFTSGNADMSCSSYDNCSAPWGSTHEESWKIIKKYDFLSGMYIWTGFDYLGEPTPYGWPAHSSYFGIIDLCGFPKDSYYMYQSEWTQKPVLHILPHWNWTPGKEIDVWVYSNCAEVELFLNGKSLGTKQKVNDDLHLSWKIPFEEGTLLAIGRTAGKEILRKEMKTAGKPAKVIITPDRSLIQADGSDLSFCTVKIVDANNVMVPLADNLVKFKVEGNGSIAGVDNGNEISLEPFKADSRKAFHGMCLLVVKAGDKPGALKITASSEGLESAIVTVNTK